MNSDPPLPDPIRRARVLTASTAFLRLRPWIVGPVALTAVALLHASPEVPVAQRRGLSAGLSLMFALFAFEARRARRVEVTPQALLASMLVTQIGIALGCAMSGGLSGPLVPLLLAPTVVGVAAFGRSRQSLALVITAGLALAAMAALPPGVPFPPLPITAARGLSLLAAVAAIALASLGATALGDAYASARAESDRAKEAALEEAADHGRALAALGAQVAHEIKNPLTAVQGLVELLAEDAGDDARARKRLAVIAGEVARIERIASEYLTCARPLGVLDPRDADLVDLARQAAAVVEARARRAGAVIVVEGRAPILARVDRRRVEEALRNLLLNAIDAGPSRVVVTVEGAPGEVVIRVRDDGRGMSAATLASIGRPFFTTREGGTGLGVVLARNAAERHGGALAFSSEEGRGTEARITLPTGEARS